MYTGGQTIHLSAFKSWPLSRISRDRLSSCSNMKTIAQWVLGDSFSEVIKTEKKPSALESILWLFWRGYRRGNDVNAVFEVSQIWWPPWKVPAPRLGSRALGLSCLHCLNLSSVPSPEGKCRHKTVPPSHGRLTLILVHELVSLLLSVRRGQSMSSTAH